MRGSTGTRHALALSGVLLVLGGCGGEPVARPTIGSPAPTPASAAPVTDRATDLAAQWELTGSQLPADWPDVPLPRGAQVVTAYAIGDDSRRTWTATFTSDTGTALDLAEPVVAELRQLGYAPIAEYVGGAETNTGLYSFSGPDSAVYVVLGEDDGQPNIVLTVRKSIVPAASSPPAARPTPAPTS